MPRVVKNTKVKSKIQEKKVAKEMNSKVTIASGALDFQKADVRGETFLTECKTTANPYYILTFKTWEKISKEALSDGLRTPLMQIQLEDGETELAVISYLDFVGYDLDTYTYIGESIPRLVEGMSVKLTRQFIDEALISKTSFDTSTNMCYYRQDIKFVDKNLHLVVLEWNDFLRIAKEKNLI